MESTERKNVSRTNGSQDYMEDVDEDGSESDSNNNNDSIFGTLDYSLPSTQLLTNNFPPPDRPSIGQELSDEIAKGFNASEQSAMTSPKANLTPQNSPTMGHAACVSSPVPSPLKDLPVSLRSPTTASAEAPPDIRVESPGASAPALTAGASASPRSAAASPAEETPAAESEETGPRSSQEPESSAAQEAAATSEFCVS